MDGSDIDPIYREFGKLVQRRRKELKLTQEELGLRVGLSRTSITNIEKGRQHVLLHAVVAFGKALDVDPGILVPRIIDDSTVLLEQKLPADLNADESRWVKRIING